MIIWKAMIIIAIIILSTTTSFLFCLSIFGNSAEEDKFLNDKEQEDYLNAWNEAQKIKCNNKNRRKNGKSN